MKNLLKNLINVGDIIEITDPFSCMQGDVMKVVKIEKELLRLMSSRGTYHLTPLPLKGAKKTSKSFNTQWLTNTWESDAESTLDKLSRAPIRRTLITSQPKPMKEYTTNELRTLNMVGIYAITQDE